MSFSVSPNGCSFHTNVYHYSRNSSPLNKDMKKCIGGQCRKATFSAIAIPPPKKKTQTHNLEFIFPLAKQFGSTKEHCRVGIVSAPVHFTINLALMLPVNKLLYIHAPLHKLSTTILYTLSSKERKKKKTALKNKSKKNGFLDYSFTCKGRASMSARRATIGGEPEPIWATMPVLATGYL